MRGRGRVGGKERREGEERERRQKGEEGRSGRGGEGEELTERGRGMCEGGGGWGGKREGEEGVKVWMTRRREKGNV